MGWLLSHDLVLFGHLGQQLLQTRLLSLHLTQQGLEAPPVDLGQIRDPVKDGDCLGLLLG